MGAPFQSKSQKAISYQLYFKIMESFLSLSTFKGSPQNIRRRLLRDVVIVITVTILVLTSLILYLGAKIRKEASVIIISDTALIVKKRFSRFIEPIETYLAIGVGWGQDGILEDMDDRDMLRLFIPMLEAHNHISGMSIADSSGEEFFLKHEGEKWLARRSSEKKGKRLAHWQECRDANHLLRSWQEEIDYDPRNRPWFLEAQGKGVGKISWTDPYLFFTAGKYGVSASSFWQSPDGGKCNVMVFDLMQDDLLNFLNTLEAGKKGHIILIESDGSLIAHNQVGRSENADVHQSVSRALELWHNGDKQEIATMEFSVGRATWWASFTPLNPNDPSSWVGVIVPESQIVGNIKKQRLKVAMAGAIVFAIGIILALRLVSKYSYQLRDLPRQNISNANFENEVLALIEAGESATLEFKSTMRANLKTGKAGKEIELAWMKTVVAFMNSDGGILLIGVDDDGNIVGTEADDFENEDKCRLHFKNLINHHIGPEFTRFIHLKIREIQEKVVLVIECERVRKPVFLTMGKNEDFYVRSGPSSLKLSMSQMVKYLEQRN